MRIFVAGATGAMGKQLVPLLVAAGHEVVGMTRSESKRAALEELGATPVVPDVLDADQVGDAVAHCSPDVIVLRLARLTCGVSTAPSRSRTGYVPRAPITCSPQ